MKFKEGRSNEDIMKLVQGEDVDHVFGNLEKYDDYFLARFADAIDKGKGVCELVQIRKEDATNVAYVEQDSYESVIHDRFEKAMERDDFDRAAKWKVLMDRLERS